MLKKIFLLTLILVVLELLYPTHVAAKRLLPRARPTPAQTSAGKPSRSTRGATISVKFRGDRRAIVITISNLGIASSVSYNLSYNSRGTTQGVGGTITPGAVDSEVRELLFGTCSAGVCRYDTGIANARLQVTTVLKNGLKVIKPFRLRV